MSGNKMLGGMLGLAVGDALGVPVEFNSRESLRQNPVTDMRSFGTHQQPAGTWSDDASLSFCLAESLCGGYDLSRTAEYFVKWYREGFWTAHGDMFDVGMATSSALDKVREGVSPKESGGSDEWENGNGSLMRILPLLAYTRKKTLAERYAVVSEVSSITHAHIRSVLSCFLYSEFALELLSEPDKHIAFGKAQARVKNYITENSLCTSQELVLFERMLSPAKEGQKKSRLALTNETEIESSGYVLHTLEAAIWSFLNTDSFSEAVLKAVNLGSDTDTTACVAGGLAGIHYGAESIPENWLEVLARKKDIEDLALRLIAKYPF